MENLMWMCTAEASEHVIGGAQGVDGSGKGVGWKESESTCDSVEFANTPSFTG